LTAPKAWYNFYAERYGVIKLSLSKGKSDPEIQRLEILLPESFARLADVYLVREEYQKAIEILEKYMNLFPGYSTGHWILGKTYYHLGKKEQALSQLRKTLQIIPEHLAALDLIGKIYMENGEQAIARSYLKQTNQIDRMGEVVFKAVDKFSKKKTKPKREPDSSNAVSDNRIKEKFATETMVKLYVQQGHKDMAKHLCKQILTEQPENNRIKSILEELEK
jgi:tetratricopeptide (TPR) repeat protein